jgi:ribonuclease D
MDNTPLVIVETEEALAAAIEQMRGEPVLGVDTEADSMHHYTEKVCLIQISDRERDYIVDPLAGFSLEPLNELMCDPKVIKVFHGADYDVVSLKRDFGFEIRGIFDTMIAAQMIDRPKVGLADIVGGLFGYGMDKKYQTCDWSLRPLSADQLDYARGDTHFLLAVREYFLTRLKRLERLEIAEEEFALVEDRVWTQKLDKTTAFLRVKRASKLDDDGKRTLRCLWEMRDGHAARLDRPPYKVVPDQVLIKLAETRPQDRDGLMRIIRAKSSMARRFGDDLLKALLAANDDERPIPKAPSKERVGTPARYGSRETERLLAQLKDWRKRVLKRDKIPMVLVMSNSQLKAIAGFRPVTQEELDGLDELRNWQVELYSAELLELVANFEAGISDEPKGRGRRRSRR